MRFYSFFKSVGPLLALAHSQSGLLCSEKRALLLPIQVFCACKGRATQQSNVGTYLSKDMFELRLTYLDFSKAFSTVSCISLDKISSMQVHNRMGEQLANRLGLKGFSKWGYIRLAASH